MSRITTGWRLAKESWALLRADRSLAIFPALSTAFSALALALLLTPGLVGAAAADKDWVVLPFLVVGGYAATFFVVYFNVALAGAARLSMDGRDTAVADGLAVAREPPPPPRRLARGPVRLVWSKDIDLDPDVLRGDQPPATGPSLPRRIIQPT